MADFRIAYEQALTKAEWEAAQERLNHPLTWLPVHQHRSDSRVAHAHARPDVAAYGQVPPHRSSQ